MLKILWKRQFLLLSTIFYYLILDFYVKTRFRFSLRDKQLVEITEVEITRVNCICLQCGKKTNKPYDIQSTNICSHAILVITSKYMNKKIRKKDHYSNLILPTAYFEISRSHSVPAYHNPSTGYGADRM